MAKPVPSSPAGRCWPACRVSSSCVHPAWTLAVQLVPPRHGPLQAGATPLPTCLGPAAGQPDVEKFDTWTQRCAALRTSLIRLKKVPLARVLARELLAGV